MLERFKQLFQHAARTAKEEGEGESGDSREWAGQLLRQARQWRLAGDAHQVVEACSKVLELQPHNAEALFLLGDANYRAGNNQAAIELIERAIAASPGEAEFHYMLGCALQDEGAIERAMECYLRTLEIEPGCAKAGNNLGCLVQARGDLNEAIACYRRALDEDPGLAQARYNLGNALREQGRFDEALGHLAQAVADRPDAAEWRTNLAGVFHDLGRLQEAAECYRRALQANPDYAQAWADLGVVLQMTGEIDEADECFRRALELSPNLAGVNSNLLLNLNYLHGDDPHTIYAEHVNWGKRYAGDTERLGRVAQGNQPQERKLRIGYVSPDFRLHSVAFFIEPLLMGHDRDRFHVIGYSDVRRPDDVTKRLQRYCSEWRSIAAMNDDLLAKLIRADGIDILVDLAGHTGRNRLLVFAERPAPVQVSYLGYPCTTGLPSMDYRLTDFCADPERVTDAFHTETLVRLPRGFLCYKPTQDSPQVVEPPCASNGYVTFASFNNVAKLTLQTLTLWAQVLNAVPTAKLLIKAMGLSSVQTREQVLERFVACGIAGERLEILGPDGTFTAHMGRYNQADIGLDVFPYNGATTTCEALWMGVPVVTLAGKTHVSRVGASILHHSGLDELVAATPEEFVAKAVALASDIEHLKTLRAGMRARLLASPLCDARRITGEIEHAYRWMWAKHCNGTQQPLSPPPPQAARRNSVLVKLREGIEICVPDSVHLLTPYVLLEQEDWFENEIKFVRKMLQPGMRAVDVGANYGVYSLAMARRVGENGMVWAIEPATQTAAYLRESLEANRMRNACLINAALSSRSGFAQLELNENSELNRLVVSGKSNEGCETIPLLTLSECASKYEWGDMDFLKIDAEGEEANIIEGGLDVLASRSPLIMFEIVHGGEINLDLVEQFSALGYSSYRLVPGLDVLIPFDRQEPLDVFQLNLFCCKPDRARQLEQAGLLVEHAGESDAPPATDDLWRDFLGKKPYATGLLEAWATRAPGTAEKGWQTYRAALNDYCQAHSAGLSARARCRSLQRAFEGTRAAVDVYSTPLRLQTCCRIAWEMGYSGLAVDTLREVWTRLEPLAYVENTEPFLPVSAGFDGVEVGDSLLEWCGSSVLQQTEKLRAFSSYYTGVGSLRLFEAIHSLGYMTPEMARRWCLNNLRNGIPVGVESFPQLLELTPDNLNPWFWRRYVPSPEYR